MLISQGWLSPELYLRRPPSRNEQYRIDRMLQAAAQRGVKVNIIVYKEVTQALTRKYLTPILPRYLHSLLPHATDPITKALSGFGLAATFAALEHVEAENPLMAPILTVSSSHTKHHLENLHPNISVFRHPDHLPDAQTLQSSFLSSLQNLSLTAKAASTLPEDTLKAIYGMNNDIILYWAHHEKLCLVDGKIAFMGGLDLCFGRWDTNQHPIADAHPSDLNNIVFPGQDFNNARIMDFQDVAHPDNNKLDRKTSSRMGWSDISISLHGPVVEDLKEHFAQRWNFIYNEKYDVRKDSRYSRITLNTQTPGALPQQNLSAVAPENRPYQSQPIYGQSSTPGQPQPYQPYQAPVNPNTSGSSPYQSYSPSQQRYDQGGTQSGQSNAQYGQTGNPQYDQPYQAYGGRVSPNPASGQQPGQYFPPPPSSRGINEDYEGESRGPPSMGHHHPRLEEEAREFRGRFETKFQHMENRMEDRYSQHQSHHHSGSQTGGMPCQIIRSCSKWSHGVPTEHSIQNAYCDVIRNSQHFVYIENQFFITATSDKQKPIKNMIGAAIVERIIRAARAGEKYKIIVVMPAIPAFAGDLKDDASLGTRAIMEFQYNSINRGGYSIMESIANAGFNPTDFIRFYNLRNYDRINASAAMNEAQRSSGIDYEDARGDHDAAVELPTENPSYGGNDHGNSYRTGLQYQPYQQAAAKISNRQGLGNGRWDSVSECYMLGGADIRSVPWENGELDEIDAFVSEELYVHSKVSPKSQPPDAVYPHMLTPEQVLIADDQIVICGSANLNDRSQLGTHDSEIAIVIQDPTPLPSTLNGLPFRASKFAATLRRQLFRKHLGLIPAQDLSSPNANFLPVSASAGNIYDFGSEWDQAVADPLSDGFLTLWNSTARTNTDIFGRVFHPVPHDSVRTWADYDTFYEHFFHEADLEAEGKEGKKKPAKYRWGHVVAEDFSGVGEVKELLSRVRGTLVEMPLLFLIKEDIAKEGGGRNAFTEEVYT